MRLKFNKFLGFLFLSFLLLLFGAVADVSAQQDSNQAGIPSTEINSTQGTAENFSYGPRGRRDPFKPLVQKKEYAKKPSRRVNKIKGPLEMFELDQYRLIAIMVVKEVPRAMIKAPDGKSYTVKIGQYIGLNDGIVKNIETKIVGISENGLRVEKSPDRIVVEEIGIDSYSGNEVKENRFIVM
ncbi:MAG: pilus assembly protein PilP [Desulfuromusa sp.]|nr:pilus assembly protein PilP [Desulfuromusa sp.]